MIHKRAGRGLLVGIAVVLAIAVLWAVVPGPGTRAQSEGAEPVINRNKIKELIYPTFGFPEIMTVDEYLVVEFDPRDQDWTKPLPELVEFEAVITPSSNSNIEPIPLEYMNYFEIDYSSRWPEYSQEKVYKVPFRIPSYAPRQLYNLTVKAYKKAGGWIEDTQPNSLQIIDEYQDEISFIQLTDIHVFGNEVSYPGISHLGRDYRKEQWSEDKGYGAPYFHHAIQQVNRIRPDFVVFTGDYDFAQLYPAGKHHYGTHYKNTKWFGDHYEAHFETDWFYQESLKLEVPVFIQPGNHDGYARFRKESDTHILEEDYLAAWRNLFGPEYFNFSYGDDYQFWAVNTMDWPVEKRMLTGTPVVLTPVTWAGQVAGGGDKYKAGWSQGREDAINVDKFTGQLKWLKDELASDKAKNAKLRAIAMHHCPWARHGEGSMFHLPLLPSGDGRLSVIKLARMYDVAMVFSGHEHRDNFGKIAWHSDPDSYVKFINTTSTQFQGNVTAHHHNWAYPGYRLITLGPDGAGGAEVENFYYKKAPYDDEGDLKQSWPLWKGTKIDHDPVEWTNQEHLTEPSVRSSLDPSPGTADEVEWTIQNSLIGEEKPPDSGNWTGDLKDAFIEIPMPMQDNKHYYVVEDDDPGTESEISRVYESTDGKMVCQVVTDVSHAAAFNVDSTKVVTVKLSDETDDDDPVCDTFEINGGALETDSVWVTLTVEAHDDTSGIRDMMIANEVDPEAADPEPDWDSAHWQPYRTEVDWKLAKMDGVRTVFIKFRDRAMLPNESSVEEAEIILLGVRPTITEITPPDAHVGDNVTILGADFGSLTKGDRVIFNGRISASIVSWEDDRIVCKVPYGSWSGNIVVHNDSGDSSSEDFKVDPTVMGISPSQGAIGSSIHIENILGRGFFEREGNSLPEGGIGHSGPPEVWIENSGTGAMIYATGVEVHSPQSISCDFNLKNATTGDYNLYVKNPDELEDHLGLAFRVTYPPPTVASITPSSADMGGVVHITNLKGTGFREGATVAFMSSKGLPRELANVNVVSSTRITGTLDLAGMDPGGWDILVTNDDGRTGFLAQGFSINYPRPTVSSISPEWGYNDQVVSHATVKGTGFYQVASVTLSRSGERAILAEDVEVDSSGTLFCDFNIKGAAPGTWNVNVTSMDGLTGSLAGGFEVRDPEIPDMLWFLGEGTTDWGFETLVTIQNPNPEPVTAVVTYMTPDGEKKRPAISMLSESQAVIAPRNDLGPVDFSTRVECVEGKTIAVDRRMIWTGPGAPSPDGHASIGVTGPARNWYLAEGSASWGFECWIAIQNPNDTEATCTITYMTEHDGPITAEKKVPPLSRRSFSMGEDLGHIEIRDASIQVSSDIPVIAERAMYRNNRRAGHASIGANAPRKEFFLAEGTTGWSMGFVTYVVVQNPNDTQAGVELTFLTSEGEVAGPSFIMEPNSRKTIRANDHLPGETDFSTWVKSNKPIVAERAMYWGADSPLGEACHASIGMPEPHHVFYFPDGETYGDHETWTLVANPGETSVEVTVTYMTPTGTGNKSVTETVPARTRKTFRMSDVMPQSRAAILVETTGKDAKVMSERAMYWNSSGAGTDTIGGKAD